MITKAAMAPAVLTAAQPGDTQYCAQLRDSLMMPLWIAEGIAPDPDERAAMCSRRSYPVGSVRIVLVDDRRAGFLDVRQRSGRLLIKWMLIEPAFQREGIGTQLVERVHREAVAQDTQGVSLEVLKSNSGARRLYERLGFRAAFDTTHSTWMRWEDA